jgi:hypothetical protein
MSTYSTKAHRFTATPARSAIQNSTTAFLHGFLITTKKIHRDSSVGIVTRLLVCGGIGIRYPVQRTCLSHLHGVNAVS